jgi:AraC-like DNA-binding protein
METSREAGAGAGVLAELREIIGRHTTVASGVQETSVPQLGLFRADQPSMPTPNVYDAMLCLVVAGRKRGFICRQTVEYVAGDALLITVDLPVVGTILEADPERPYLAVNIRLHRPTVAAVVLESEPTSISGDDRELGMRVARASPEVLDATLRLVRLLDHPRDIAVLAPLVEREILYRLLMGPWGRTLLEISRAESRLSQVSRAVEWLRTNYADDFSAEALARVATMSVSSLNRHFRAVTAMSPLEYQKQIRLQEARRRLLVGADDVTGVGYAVGYRSVSQFTREYRRQFGEPPGRDAERLRSEGLAAS